MAVLVVCLVGALLPFIPFIQEGEDQSIDARFAWRGPLPEKSRVIVVAIDDATERAWRETPKAMWSGELAKLVRTLNTAGATRVGLDFLISVDPDNYLSSKGIDETPNADLDQAIIETGERVILGTSRAGDVVAPLDFPSRLASVNRSSPSAGVVRQLPRHDRSFVPPLRGLAAALVDESPEQPNPIEINYSGRQPFLLSARDVLEGRSAPDLFRGAVVIIGETYEGSSDLHPTPFGWNVPGVLIHAEAARTLLDRNELRVWSTWSASFVTLFASFMGGWIAARVMIWRFYLVVGGAGIIWSLGCFVAFCNMHIVLPWFAPMIASLILAPGMIYAIRAIEEYQERLYARTRWGQLVGESTVRRLEDNRKAGRGAWENFSSCLMFLDIAGFSRITRKKSTSETLDILNRVFSEAITCIDQSGGEVIDFAGDGLAAKWELPTLAHREDPHGLVLRSALDTLDRIDELNRSGELGTSPLRIRMGLTSGQTTLALVGSEGRQKMTLVGEVVNLAARLEQLGKDKEVNSRLVVSVDYSDAVTTSGRHFERGQKQLNGWDAPVEFLYLVESPSNVT